MKSVIEIPLGVIKFPVDGSLRVIDVGTHVVFGGLVAESKCECLYHEKALWEPGCANGKIVKKGAFRHALSVPVGTAHEWWPDDDAMDGIEHQALVAMGVGDVKWFGACGSKTDPLHAGFREKGGEWIVGDRVWSWRDAINQLMAVAAVKDADPVYETFLREAATSYGKAVLETLRTIRRGEVYGVVVAAVPKGSTQPIKKCGREFWGHIGKDYASQVLSEVMDEVAGMFAGKLIV